VDVGHGKIDVAAVSVGATNLAASRRMPMAGQDLNAFLLQLLQRRGTPLRDARNVRSLKALCARAADSPWEFDLAARASASAEPAGAEPPASYSLPDGQEISLSASEAMLSTQGSTSDRARTVAAMS
jgi:hypothetical protein